MIYRTRVLPALLLFFVSLLVVGGTTSAQQGYEIVSVQVEGNRSVESSLILTVSGLRTGMILSSTAVQDAIRRIYGLQLFSDVAVDGQFSGGGIEVKIVVVEHPKLKELKFSGNKKIDDDDIKARLTIFANQVVTPNQIRENVEKIKTLYHDEGYHLVEVEAETSETADAEIDLTYKIVEKEKVKIRDIIFAGNEVFDDGELRGKMGNKPKGFLRSGNFDEVKYEEDKDKIIEFYHQEGYLDAAITGDSIAIDPDGKRMVIHIDVYEGERYYFGEVSFTGNQLYDTKFLRKQLKFETGDVYDSEKFEESMQNIYSIYYEDGHIHARVLDQVQTIDTTLTINLEISEGMPAKINKVHIVGNHKTKEKVIRRELYSQPGHTFRRSLLMRSLRNAMYLNYFGNVEPELKQLPNGDVDLVLKVEEKTTGQVQAGAGYSDYDKLVGTVGLGIPNFMGNGQSLTLDWQFGKRRNSVSVSFTEPWFLDTPTSVGIDLYNINRRHSLFDGEFMENSRGFGLRLGRRLRWPDDYFRIYWRYRLENDRLYDFDDQYRQNHPIEDDPHSLLQYENEYNTTSAMSWTVTRDSRDLSQFATSGSMLSYNIEYSGGVLGGKWHFHKHIFDAAKYMRLWWRFVLAAKMKIGVLDSPDGESKIPYIERFAPGGTYGDGVVRGYDDRSIGPRSELGSYLRGRSMLIYNLELQVALVEQQIYGLLFADAGNAWLSGQAMRPFDFDRYDGFKKSYGVGFRIVVPGLGVIGFDFAYGLNNPDGAGWKPHFQIGSTF
ncbi:MAG: outer membrane protein assembly factor BamA [candidate division Zixibacteria bacterium]|nr:outer membrane protein assembly factor BamA [candidate division Zixibacteria bacterium]